MNYVITIKGDGNAPAVEAAVKMACHGILGICTQERVVASVEATDDDKPLLYSENGAAVDIGLRFGEIFLERGPEEQA